MHFGFSVTNSHKTGAEDRRPRFSVHSEAPGLSKAACFLTFLGQGSPRPIPSCEVLRKMENHDRETCWAPRNPRLLTRAFSLLCVPASVKSMHLLPATPDYSQASNLGIRANSCSSQQEASAGRIASAVRVKRKEFLPPLSGCSSLTSVSTITPESSPPPQNTKDRRERKQLRAGDAAENRGSASEAQGPEPAESRVQGSFSTGIPAAESVPEALQLPSLLQGRDQDVWAQKHQDTVPSCQEPRAVESTVINIPGGLDGELDVQQMPRTLVVMPFVPAPESLPAIKEECGEEGTPVTREVGGCTPMKAPVPSSPTPVTMIVMPEDPELGDRAPQLV